MVHEQARFSTMITRIRRGPLQDDLTVVFEPAPAAVGTSYIFVVCFGYIGASYLQSFADAGSALKRVQEIGEFFKPCFWSPVCV